MRRRLVRLLGELLACTRVSSSVLLPDIVTGDEIALDRGCSKRRWCTRFCEREHLQSVTGNAQSCCCHGSRGLGFESPPRTLLIGPGLGHGGTENRHTHTHPFNGTLSGTTRVSRYEKGKTNLDFTEARDSEWQWNQLSHMQVCT